MTTPHNRADKSDYAESVLMPGDPLRAKWIAENFLDEPVLVNDVRGCLGYTGRYKGARISVQASGMGQPSIAIYAHELMNHYGVEKLIRVGTCGGFGGNVEVRDIVIAQGACTDSSLVRSAFGSYGFAPLADFGLLRKAVETAEASDLRFHVGNVLSSDVFYTEEGFDSYRRLADHGVLAVEMEAAALYTLAARFKKKALAICAMTDCLATGAEIDSSERQSSLTHLAKLSLDVAVA